MPRATVSTCDFTAKAQDRSEAERLIAPLESQVRARLGDAIYGIDGETPQGVVAELLDAASLTFVVLEIGVGAIGAVGPSLGAHPSCLGVFGGRDIEAAGKSVADQPLGSGEVTLNDIMSAIIERLGADIALVVQVDMEPISSDGSSVRFSTEIVFLHEDDGRGPQRASYSWRTTPSEVGRLVGLAALNHMRHSLLALSRGRKQGIAV